MQNFSTNQFRNLYVAKAVKTGTTAVSAAGDIKVVATKDNEDIVLQYVNGDGIVTHSDLINVANITNMNRAAAAKLATPLMKQTVTLTSGVTLASLVGKHVCFTINLREYIGLDYSENYPITVDVYVESSTAATFWGALKTAVEDALAPFGSKAPVEVSGGSSNLVITEKAQKWVRGKLAATPIHFELESSLVPTAANPQEFTAWAAISAPEASGSTISGNYKLADLEYFTMGERGDIIRTYAYPNDYNPTYLINPASDAALDVLTIEFYYQGNAEDVQKSPKTIQVAGAEAVITALENAVKAVVSPSSAS